VHGRVGQPAISQLKQRWEREHGPIKKKRRPRSRHSSGNWDWHGDACGVFAPRAEAEFDPALQRLELRDAGLSGGTSDWDADRRPEQSPRLLLERRDRRIDQVADCGWRSSGPDASSRAVSSIQMSAVPLAVRLDSEACLRGDVDARQGVIGPDADGQTGAVRSHRPDAVLSAVERQPGRSERRRRTELARADRVRCARGGLERGLSVIDDTAELLLV
jgi:hypothetical protein